MDQQLRAPRVAFESGRTSFSRLVTFSLEALSRRPLLNAFRKISAIYIFMLVLLPSGSVSGINLKVLCFLLLLPLAAQVSFARGQITPLSFTRLLVVPAVLLLWAFLSQLYGVDASQALWQYEFLMTTICSCWFAFVLCDRDEGNSRFILRCVIYSEVFTSSLKIAILVYSFARGLPLSAVFDWIQNVFGVKLMGYDFGSALGRFAFISDNVIPVCIFAILCFRKQLGLRGGRSLSMLCILMMSSLFSFSRFLWAHTAVALILGLLLGKKDRFQMLLIAILAGLTAIGYPFVSTVVTLRFSSAVVTGSDAARVQQIAALQDFVADAPWFGHGLGSYSHRSIRSDDAPFVYEVQLLALVGQVGIVGVALLFVLLMSYYRWFWPLAPRSRLRSIGLLVLMLTWLAGGFFNPSVISSAASVSYAAIFAMVMLNNRPGPLAPTDGAEGRLLTRSPL